MSGITKAVIVVIILGLIAIAATLPAQNFLKVKVASVTEYFIGKFFKRKSGTALVGVKFINAETSTNTLV